MTKHPPRRPLPSHGSHLTDPYRDLESHRPSLAFGTTKSLTAISRELGSCVYFIRCNDGAIKIGTTTDIASRKRAFGSGWQHILAIEPGDATDERALHAEFAAYLRRGREFFDPAPVLIERINEIRARLGVPSIAA